jgi:hypothetical protein
MPNADPVPNLFPSLYTVYEGCESGSSLFWEAVLVFLNVYGAPELMPRNEFRQPM